MPALSSMPVEPRRICGATMPTSGRPSSARSIASNQPGSVTVSSLRHRDKRCGACANALIYRHAEADIVRVLDKRRHCDPPASGETSFVPLLSTTMISKSRNVCASSEAMHAASGSPAASVGTMTVISGFGKLRFYLPGGFPSHWPMFSYHFKTPSPMHAISGAPSPLRSVIAHPAAGMLSSRTDFAHVLPSNA